MKAVIPVAGLGTRMLPATKAIPKEMLTIVDKPIIQYIVDECVNAGIKEIVLITHASKNAIENHFDISFELETILERRIKRQLLEEMRSIVPRDVKLLHIRQGYAKGLGHAILCARVAVGNSPFAVLLPDVILAQHTFDPKQENLSAMISRFHETGANQIMVTPVDSNLVHQYGIIDHGDVPMINQPVKIKRIVEKPNIKNAPSNLAVVGRYVFSSKIWDVLERTPMGVDDEIQLTDAIDMLLQTELVEAFPMVGKSFDCGNKLGYFQAFVEFGLQHPQLGAEFTKIIKEILE